MQAICPCHPRSNARFLFLDTGGTQHISNNATTLSAVQAYYGNNKVLVGDGKHLPISHVGSKLLSTAHTNFKLNKVFHVPNIAAKFISAPNFAMTIIHSLNFILIITISRIRRPEKFCSKAGLRKDYTSSQRNVFKRALLLLFSLRMKIFKRALQDSF